MKFPFVNKQCRLVQLLLWSLYRKKWEVIANWIVELDENKIWKRKYHKEHQVEGQWEFGGIESEVTGKVEKNIT